MSACHSNFLLLSIFKGARLKSMIADHCRAYALSYPQDDDHIKKCDHEHNARCGRCEILLTVFHEIQKVLGSVDYGEERDDIEYEISEVRQNIQA